ncbi:sugar ABC transporter substrate-binding protein [Paenibacillus sp. FSL R5-0490]|uniref:sugar ABC transporter substrate-binding protein n=1 Tax=Bacillales TaxID=1385 RepID=UPI00096F966E|nr:substrate-binding domain-containing protein [Paenibacillus sp. FSL R5-0490]OMF56820.1 sugar ABC transporter substrate-binding protein [Paenibacillus sp. FSL R5-0490]
MRKTGILIFCLTCIVLGYFTFTLYKKAFTSERDLPAASDGKEVKYRLVLITQELETPFWDKAGIAAQEQARKDGASLEVWGSYGKNQEEFLKKLEIAIQSKVDGIIVQGLDTQEFKDLAKIKAAFYGIPIITVANDVPKSESLRKTYVGSDQYLAGQLIAEQLLDDMGHEGKVILMGDKHKEYYQQQRLDGIHEVLKDYPNIQTVYAETTDVREEIIASTQNMLNQNPDTDSFVAIKANIAGAMIHEIGRRSLVEPYYIYSFDDGPDSISLLTQGKLDGIIEQSPEKMGSLSAELILKWLRDEEVPLKSDGYLTDIRILKTMEKK